MSEAPGRQRGRETAGDMVRSLLLVLVLVAVVIALTVRPHPKSEVRRFDYTGVLAQARSQAPYDVLAPRGLSRDWRATSARAGQDGTRYAWHLGFVSPDGDYAGLEQGDGDPAAFLDEVSADGHDEGRVTIDGLRWRRVEGGHPEPRALVLEGDAVTTVVAGGASWRELRELAGALRAG